MLKTDGRKMYAGVEVDREASLRSGTQVDKGQGDGAASLVSLSTPSLSTPKTPLRGILALGAMTPAALKEKLDDMFRKVQGGWTPPALTPNPGDLSAPERLVIDFGDHDELIGAHPEGAQGDGVRQSQRLEGAGGPGRLPGHRPGSGQDCLSLPRPGQSVRQYGSRIGGTRSGRRPASSRRPIR